MQKNFKCCLVAVMFLATTVASAQVTVGSGKVPEDFSVLELVNNELQGLRLPQMTTAQRTILEGTDAFKDEKTNEAMGLQIFNTDTRCVETWNGTTWIGACAPVHCADLPATVTLCSTSTPTIADLNNEVGAAVSWYAADTGGEALASTYELIVGVQMLYAGNCSDQGTRQGIMVEIQNCSTAVIAANIRVTTFTNVMYDFQHQTLEPYVTAGGVGTEYQWQVSTTQLGPYTDIPNATSPTYTVPADVIHNPSLLGLSNFAGIVIGDSKADGELCFRVKMRNPLNKGTWAVQSANYALAIAFIKTTNSGQGSGYLSGYGELNGVKYLDINTTSKSGSVKERVALLNLGQSGTGSFNMGVQQQPDDAANLNDASDLGDLYQWGRIADGHEKIVWGKYRTTDANSTYYMRNDFAAGTSEVITHNGVFVYTPYATPPDDSQAGQVTDTDYVGKFIRLTNNVTGEWGDTSTAARARWGNGGTNTRAATADQLSEWSYVNNNVCPSGWRVPSNFEWWDMYRGDGSNTPSVVTTTPYVSTAANINDWFKRNEVRNVAGGIIVNNSDGRKLFLPSTKSRNYQNGKLMDNASYTEVEGRYCTSTNETGKAYMLSFSDSNLSPGSVRSTGNAHALAVRCVAE